jgi:hypothetical protein
LTPPLVKGAVKSRDTRKDLDSIDLLRALVGVANLACSPDWQQRARRLVDILLSGSQAIKPSRQSGGYRETGFAEIIGDVLEPTCGPHGSYRRFALDTYMSGCS